MTTIKEMTASAYKDLREQIEKLKEADGIHRIRSLERIERLVADKREGYSLKELSELTGLTTQAISKYIGSLNCYWIKNGYSEKSLIGKGERACDTTTAEILKGKVDKRKKRLTRTYALVENGVVNPDITIDLSRTETYIVHK